MTYTECLAYGLQHSSAIVERIGKDGIVTLSDFELATMLAAAWSDGHCNAINTANAIIARTTAALEQEHLGDLSSAERSIARAMNDEDLTRGGEL